jgi:AcrR family transcriptional regulator
MNRRERQVQNRRQEILKAALSLFEKKGVLDTSMEEIAVAADVARGTLYNHFPSKAEVLLALTDDIAQHWLLSGLAKLEKTKSYLLAIREVLVSAAGWFDEHPEGTSAFYHAMREIMGRQNEKTPPPTLVPREWVESAQREGQLTSELPADMIVLMFDTVLRHNLVEQMRGTQHGKLVSAVKKHADIVGARLAP